jgi:transcription termination/antitermination protein NusG
MKDIALYGYHDWTVVHANVKQIPTVIQLLKKYHGSRINILSLRKEVVHKKKDTYKKALLPLFPGYIFISGYNETILDELKQNFPHLYVNPVSFGGELGKVNRKELEVLLNHTDEHGLIRMSTAYRQGENITVTSGPLMDLKGKILFVNIKKRKAKISVTLFNKTIDISLGLDFIEPPERISA